MKRLYARLMLWLITPALEAKAQAEQAARAEAYPHRKAAKRAWMERSVEIWHGRIKREEAATADETATG